MRKLVLFIFISFIILSCSVSAIPTTGAATMVGNNNASLSATGSSGTDGWFQWGMKTGKTWSYTSNVTISGDLFHTL